MFFLCVFFSLLFGTEAGAHCKTLACPSRVQAAPPQL